MANAENLESLEAKLFPVKNKLESLITRVKNIFSKAYNKIRSNDPGFITMAGLGGMAALVYGFWGTDFAMLSAENEMPYVVIPLIVRTTCEIKTWMTFNTALNILGVISSGEGAKRLGKVVAERDFYKKQFEQKESKGLEELCKNTYKEIKSSIKSKLSKIGLVIYSAAQGGIVATFLLANSNYNIDAGLVWNDLLLGAASGIVMYVAGKYYEGKASSYEIFDRLKD
jgi:hypothetical protein